MHHYMQPLNAMPIANYVLIFDVFEMSTTPWIRSFIVRYHAMSFFFSFLLGTDFRGLLGVCVTPGAWRTPGLGLDNVVPWGCGMDFCEDKKEEPLSPEGLLL